MTLLVSSTRDQFKSESPTRAFSDWNPGTSYAVGKGFRPSLAHTVQYLDALLVEGWELVQILQGDSADPTFIFKAQ